MKAAAPSKTTKIIEILDRIESNSHFSQSLNDFFATNQKINPARLVILEAMKKGPDMGAVLRGGSFASAANAYLHLSNLHDHDSAFFKFGPRSNSRQGYTRSPRTYMSNESTTPFRNTRRSSYSTGSSFKRLGYCFKFNSMGGCSFGILCRYKHICSRCESSRHGVHECPQIRRPYGTRTRSPRRTSPVTQNNAPGPS